MQKPDIYTRVINAVVEQLQEGFVLFESTDRFGSDAYAVKEQVAELSAAFL